MNPIEIHFAHPENLLAHPENLIAHPENLLAISEYDFAHPKFLLAEINMSSQKMRYYFAEI